MDYDKVQNLPLCFLSRRLTTAMRPFCGASRKANGVAELERVADRASKLSRGLRARVQKGDRVGIVAENRPEWLIADLAIMAAGAITVPAYTTNTVKVHSHPLRQRHPPIVSHRQAWTAPIPAAVQTACDTVIALEPFEEFRSRAFR